MKERADRLSAEANEVNERRLIITQLSNLALQLYGWYIKNGHARNVQDAKEVKKYFLQNLPEHSHAVTGFYEQLYYFQSFCWYAYIRQDYLLYYRYTQKWVDLFAGEPVMIGIETGHYIKGMHNLLNAHFMLRNYRGFEKALKQFEAFSQTENAMHHNNFRIQTFVYVSSAKINRHFLLGTFHEGLKLIPVIKSKLKEYSMTLDIHRILVLNYKIATLYFGSGDCETSIDYLQKIINNNFELRTDLQCYARLLHLIAHYELGNLQIMDHLIKSVYRFMAKMKNLTVVEEEIFRFLKSAFRLSRSQLKQGLQVLLEKIKGLENNRFETRSFAYLDIISWLESKASGKTICEIIRQKHLQSKRAIV